MERGQQNVTLLTIWQAAHERGIVHEAVLVAAEEIARHLAAGGHRTALAILN